MSDKELFASFAEVLALSQAMKDDLPALLDPETGFAPRMRQLCMEHIQELEEAHASPKEIEVLRLEEHTWSLLQALLPARKTEFLPKPTAQQLIAINPYTTALVVVREWLQDTAPTPPIPEATTGGHNVLQGMRSGNTYRDGLVKELDPDAPNREEGRALASDDASYEKGLLQALYACVRAGRLEDAVDFCRRAHQPWRASSILGSRLFAWPAISTESKDDDAMAEDDAEFWHGNRRRKLWKKTCIHAALNNTLSDQERLLYAALAPSPLTAMILKSACRTWEDHLWVQISIICEEKESLELSRLSGSFWEGGEPEELDQEEWEAEVIETLDTLQDVAVLEGPKATHAFHFSQLHIILNRTDQLLKAFDGTLSDEEFRKDTFEYAQLTRFFAHLCLFLQLIDIPTPPIETQHILEAYLQVLEQAEQRPLIAMYAGALGDNAVERYALFLVSLELNADVGERRLALTRANEHGLDMYRVAVVTAERTIERAFDLLPEPKGPLPSIIALPQPPTVDELFLLRSIEWTTFHEETYEVALEQTNVILRYFLGVGRVQAALSLLEMLPSGLADISEPETRLLRQGDLPLSKDERAGWLSQYRNSIDQAHEQVTTLLTTEWLVPNETEVKLADRRTRELLRIRQLYIPEIIFRLHFILINSRQWIPENLKRALKLADIVADSRYKLYDDFVKPDGPERLGKYLRAVKEAFVAGLEKGGSDPFRPILAAL
ncbi:nuclear pore complex protein [Ephemerocybe angulata]|uniref:Nuclear pore complex protein n=1 Tax=Ephemerocybe angulata TaxID=980116 RepID=A0A8H6LYC9_9AGAR|nr:nuclear pore complex protein [Tulosesus angulatus]